MSCPSSLPLSLFFQPAKLSGFTGFTSGLVAGSQVATGLRLYEPVGLAEFTRENMILPKRADIHQFALNQYVP